MFKKLSFFALAILLLSVTSFANAANIPTVTSPADTGEKWITQGYNNGPEAISEGDVVVWDIGRSTGDDYMYIKTVQTASTGPIAGIANEAIAKGAVGSIVIYGLKDANISTTTTATESYAVGTSSVYGEVAYVDLTATDIPLEILGVAVGAPASGKVPVFINIR